MVMQGTRSVGERCNAVQASSWGLSHCAYASDSDLSAARTPGVSGQKPSGARADDKTAVGLCVGERPVVSADGGRTG